MTDDAVKEALYRIPYGFYNLTSAHEGNVNAMVFNWFTQSSFTPRLVTIGLARKSYTHGLVEKSGVFAVNIYNREDQDIMTQFSKARAKAPDKMEGVSYTLGPETGCPIIEGAAAYIECKVVQMIDVGGDHDLLVGEVINGAILKPGSVEETLTLQDVGWSYAG
jgi:flavin reductase (DIM6/NTAB) family NADH-FMN oxidoreductase RutF